MLKKLLTIGLLAQSTLGAQAESLWTSQEGTKGQDAIARSMAGCEDMIERLTEPVAAHILKAAAQDQVILGHLPAAERSEEQLATVDGQHRG
jgi:hypothetical protein